MNMANNENSVGRQMAAERAQLADFFAKPFYRTGKNSELSSQLRHATRGHPMLVSDFIQ